MGAQGFPGVSVSSASSPSSLPTAAGTGARRVEMRGNFRGTESIWDVGARAKQTRSKSVV